MTVFRTLANVPVHYDRYPAGSGAEYGTKGRPYAFRATPSFIAKMEAMFTELFSKVPARFGTAEVLTSAGAFVNKPGYHGLGRAFDLDGIFFKNKTFITLNFPTDREFYLGVEAVIRKHFGTVLNYDYDLAHQDHFHFDDGTNVGWNSMTKSRVVFVQNAMNVCYGRAIQADGVWGPESQGALRDTLRELSIGTISQRPNWLLFLDRISQDAFSIAP